MGSNNQRSAILILLHCLVAKVTTAFVLQSTLMAGKFHQGHRDLLKENILNASSDVTDQRDISLLEEWANNNDITVSPAISLSAESGGNFGITLHKSSKELQTVLSVPKKVVLDSEYIRREWIDYVTPAMEFIERSGLNDSALNFLLMAKILKEYSLGEESRWYSWISSLPETFDTGVCMNEVEMDCLPPFALAIANFEDQQLEIFRQAFEMVKKTDLFSDCDTVFDDKTTKWAFNVVTTRSWRYQQDDNDNDMIRPIMVPFGDMFNHKEPPNVVVRDADNFDAVEFVLAKDVELDESKGEECDLFLSYGLTNPHRFLGVFGFVDETMPEVFCQVLFNNPTPELIRLGCNDRSKMVYRTTDGGISTAVWDCILHTLLAQVPFEQDEFYTAHIEKDIAKKAEFHTKYALEESLTLRNHVEGTANELKELLDKIDALGDYDKDEHPRLELIKRHNEFLYRVFHDLVLARIDQRAQIEVIKRRGQ